MYFTILLTIHILSTSDNKTHKWIFVGLAVLSTLRHLHMSQQNLGSVALLYLNQCPLNSILSKCLSLFVQFNQSLQNVN